MSALTKLHAWKKLKEHRAVHYKNYHECPVLGLRQQHAKHYSVVLEHLSLDYSEQCLDDDALALLFDLADACHVQEHIESLMNGDLVNYTGHSPALHTALRAMPDELIEVNGHNVVPDVMAAREQMREISEKIRQGAWLGYTGMPITDIVNVGIGGSFLGAFFCMNAFSDLVSESLHFGFVSDIDPHSFEDAVRTLNPETTLFIIASKTFTTRETLLNMKKALVWLGKPKHIDKHFIAITEWTNKPKEFGINNVIPIWGWVGGRYSSCSAINLLTCIAIGYERFSELLMGAHSMDVHFRTAKWSKNAPVLLALLGIWNNNFLGIDNLLVLTYSLYLQQFIPYLQQLDMESNGKSLDKNGVLVNYPTGPIIWGGLGNQVQHSYYQLLCQGTHRIAADLISVNLYARQIINHLCSAHKTVLSHGGENNKGAYDDITAKIPMNHIRLRDSTPQTIGALIALYEHKIYVQSVIWNINPFDQPGVDSSKKLMWPKG
jgi:glucose-6-phosphate isomerase